MLLILTSLLHTHIYLYIYIYIYLNQKINYDFIMLQALIFWVTIYFT